MSIYTELFNEFKEYCKLMEKELNEYTGYEINLICQWICQLDQQQEEVIELGFNASSPIKYPPMEEFIQGIVDKILEMISDTTNLKESLDWELFETLRKKISVDLIFDNNIDEKENYRRMKFLSDLISVGNKSYEGKSSDIGVIFSEVDQIEQIANQYEFNVILLEKNLELNELFSTEKPFLKLVDGNTINLLVDKDFKIYGLAVNISATTNISEIIEQNFEETRLIRSIDFTKEALANAYSSLIEKEYYKEIDGEKLQSALKSMLIIMKETVQKASAKSENTSPKFIYFKLNNGELEVFNGKDFIISYSKGNWKLKNYNLLQFILMRQLLMRNQIYLLIEESLDNSKLLKDVTDGTKILFNTIKKLSQTNSSSIIMFTPIKPEEIAYSNELTLDEVKESLSKLPLKPKYKDYLYLKLIQRDDIHLNVINVGVPFLSNICSIDGAVVIDDMLNILSYGEIIEVPTKPNEVFGTGTNACKIASENGGLAIKVSEDGDIKVYLDGELILTL